MNKKQMILDALEEAKNVIKKEEGKEPIVLIVQWDSSENKFRTDLHYVD